MERYPVSSSHHTTSAQGPLPIVVGVTGHIDLAPTGIEPVRERVHALLKALKDAFPTTSIVVASALAGGADQLVARVGLALGLPLYAILPMPFDAYALTLPNDDDRASLTELWEHAIDRVELPLIDAVPNGPNDKYQYEQVGLTISHFSHVLLALWNGENPWDPNAPEAERLSQQGGTAHILYLRTAGETESTLMGRSPIFPQVHTRLHPADDGLTLRISTPRIKSAESVGDAGSIWHYEQDGERIAEYPFDPANMIRGTGSSVVRPQNDAHLEDQGRLESTLDALAMIDRANSMLVEIERKQPDAIARAGRYLLSDASLTALGDQYRPAVRIRRAYALTDIFSLKYQRKVFNTIWWLTGSLLIAVLAYEFYAHTDTRGWLLCYLAAITIPALIHQHIVTRNEWQNRFQDYRALAEATRVQFFWGLSGITCGVPSFYLRKHQDELGWIRFALRGIGLDAVIMGLGPIRQELVRKQWLEDQLSYFAGSTDAPERLGKARLNARSREQFDRYITWAYMTGPLLAALLLLPVWPERMMLSAAILMGFAPALAGGLSVIVEKRAFKDHAHQYGRMGRMYGRALKLVDALRPEDDKAFSNIMRELGTEALAENADWLMSHRDRKVEPIKGG